MFTRGLPSRKRKNPVLTEKIHRVYTLLMMFFFSLQNTDNTILSTYHNNTRYCVSIQLELDDIIRRRHNQQNKQTYVERELNYLVSY